MGSYLTWVVSWDEFVSSDATNNCQANELQGSGFWVIPTPFPELKLQTWATVPSFSTDAGNPNLAPHACPARHFTDEPSLPSWQMHLESALAACFRDFIPSFLGMCPNNVKEKLLCPDICSAILSRVIHTNKKLHRNHKRLTK
jgi:hypothetical protein